MMKNKKGFTLIELLVVMTIVAVLAGISLVSYQGARRSARDGKRKTDLEQIRSALEMCRADADNGSYPAGLLYSGDEVTCSVQASDRDYLTIPSDPIPGKQYVYTRVTANSYTLCASLENESGIGTGCGDCGPEACNYKVVSP